MEDCSPDSKGNYIPAGRKRKKSFDQIEKWMGCYREWIAKLPAAAEHSAQ